MPHVTSSAINWVVYDRPSRTLAVGFKEGRDYDYLDVPQDVYDGLLAAPSKGKFYNARIKDFYPVPAAAEVGIASILASTDWRSAARRRGRA